MPSGLLGGLLASSLVVTCTVVNFDPEPTLVCSDRSVRQISYVDWPQEWHGPELGFAYELRDGKPVVSVRDEEALAESIRRSRFHQRRFMREALQNPKKQ